MASTEEIEEFMNGALVLWIESCLEYPENLSGYSSLLDGSIIFNVYLQIDSEPQYYLSKCNGLVGTALCTYRAKNFDAICKNLRTFYEEELGQVILRFPDCSLIGHSSESKDALEQMRILLTLLLGAAVQSPNKEKFIANITKLDLSTQHEIVELIKKVTDTQSLVLANDNVADISQTVLYNHVKQLIRERDRYQMKLILALDVESDNTFSGEKSTLLTENNHLVVELADVRAKLRKLKQELDEKLELYTEVKEELEHRNIQYEKLRTESQTWYTAAQKTAAYRDEVDFLRERIARADMLETEVLKLREKLTESDFYKMRVEELREDNRMLVDTKEMLEEQLQRFRKRSEVIITLESENIKLQQTINELILDRESDKSKIQELVEENTHLLLTVKKVDGDALNFEKSLLETKLEYDIRDNLSEQLTSNAQTEMLKLELENKKLLASIDQLKEKVASDSASVILEHEKEKKRLTLQIDQLRDTCKRLADQNNGLDKACVKALDENKKLQELLALNQRTNDKQGQERELDLNKILELEQQMEKLVTEKRHLEILNETLQRSAENTEEDLKCRTEQIKSLEQEIQESGNLRDQLVEHKTKILRLEKETKTLTKDINRLKDNLEIKSQELESNNARYENLLKENKKLTDELEQTDSCLKRVYKFEQISKDLEFQKTIDVDTISTLQNQLIDSTLFAQKLKANLDMLGIKYSDLLEAEINIKGVVDNLIKTPLVFKTLCEVMTSSHQSLKEGIFDLLKTSNVNVFEHLEFEEKSVLCGEDVCSDDDSNAARISKGKLFEKKYDHNCFSKSDLQKEFKDLQAENAKLNINLSTLQSKILSSNSQHQALQLANSQLASEKDVLLKNLDTAEQERKHLLTDQITLQSLHEQLNCEYDSLTKEREKSKYLIKDLRNENRNLKEECSQLQKISENSKLELCTLKSVHEDLINLRTEHFKLTDDFRNLFSTNDKFKNEYKKIQDQYKILRAENNRLKLQNTEISGELTFKDDFYKSLEIKYKKEVQKCEMLLQMNANLDSDRRTLMDHVSQLLFQYHELLSHSLEDKQHYHDEEKSYTDKVNCLNRQKEKLEEKIMEHYRKLDNCTPKKKAFGSNFVKRVKKASTDFISKVPNKNRHSWVEKRSFIPYTVESESGGNESDNSLEDSTLLKDGSADDIESQKNCQRSNRQPELLNRGGVRSSLQNIKHIDSTTSRRNSIHGLPVSEDSDIQSSLGKAGSRRTVYVIEENRQFKNADQCGNENDSYAQKSQTLPSQTLLMYNRVNTSYNKSNENLASSDKLPTDVTTDTNILDTTENTTERMNSIWYEYGCV